MSKKNIVKALRLTAGGLKKAFGHYSEIVITTVPCIIISSLLNAFISFTSVIVLWNGQTVIEMFPAVIQWNSYFSLLANAGIMMMPVFIIWATARHFGSSEILAILIGLTMISSDMISGMSYSLALQDGTLEYWRLGLASIPKAGFQGQMLCALCAGLVFSWLEKFLHKVITPTLQIFIVPLTSVVVTQFFIFTVVGPAARAFETWITEVSYFLLMSESLRYVSGFLLGLLTLPMMLIGAHFAFIPVNVQLVASIGNTPIWSITVSAVLACGASALADLYLLRKAGNSSDARGNALITLVLGTVEPSLFGVCAKKGYAMKGAITASALAGLTARIGGCTANSFGLNGFLSYLGTDPSLWLPYSITLLVAVGGGFLLTCMFYYIEKRKRVKA